MPFIATDGRQTLRPAPRRKLLSTSTVITLIATMMALTIAGVLHIATQQTELAAVRADARLARMTSQALTELDATVLRFLIREDGRPDEVDYGRKASRLESLGVAQLPRTVRRGTDEVPANAALASLKAAWDDVVANLDAGDVAAARNIYAMRHVERDMNAFSSAFAAALEGHAARYAEIERRIDLTIWACLIGQLICGLASIAAFVSAARRGARESLARASAISTADSAREQVTRLFEMTDMLQSANDLADANAVLRSAATRLLPDYGGALYVFNNSRDRLALSTHWGMGENIDLADTIGVQQCWALKRGKPHLNGPQAETLCCEHHDREHNALELPMIARGEILGLLQIYTKGDDALARLASIASVGAAIADAMSLALANLALRDKLRSQALRDPLTGLYNRRYMEDTLQRVVRLAERERSEVSLLMIDLDHFKRLNDNHGHAKGDAVLRDVAQLIVRDLRESDVACRYGGEELLVILPQCGLAMAASKAERLRVAIEALSETGGAEVSASFGVASIPATSLGTHDVMAAADAALYQAKQAGRNRVICAPPSAAPEAAAKAGSEAAAFRSELAAAE